MSSPLSKQDDVFEWDQDAIERLLDRMEPRLAQAFLAAVLVAQRENTLDELTDLAREGRLMDVINDIANAGAGNLSDAINAAFIDSGVAVAAGMAETFEQVISFDRVNVRAVEIMQQNRLRLIVEFAQEQRIATREALQDGIRRGLNPRDTAREFRSSIGLTSRQQRAVQNYRRLLEQGSSEALNRQLRDRRFDPTVRRAVRGDLILTPEQINRMVQRYRERTLKFRSEVIARTESLRAVHEGTEEGFRQALENRVIDARTLVRTWHVRRDGRERDSHHTMQGQKRQIGEAFLSGAGNRLRFPGDINAPASETIQCRCAVSTRVLRLSVRAA